MKAERTIACHEILATLKIRIKTRVEFILANEHSDEEPTYLPVSAPFSPVTPHEIHLAVKNNQLTCIQTLAQQDQRFIHVEDAFKQPALLWAAAKGYHDIASFLIENGANVNQATQLPDLGIHQKNHQNTPLDWGIIGRHFVTIDVLLNAGAICNNWSDCDLLFLMIEANNIFQVRKLIERNPHLLNRQNDIGYTPLHYAAFFGQLDIARYFIDEGVDFDFHTPEATGKYKTIACPNQTAFDIACQQGNAAMVTMLFEAGATVTPTRNARKQAIHVFAHIGALSSVKALIESCPEHVHARDARKNTPLDWAIFGGYTDTALTLIEAGATAHLVHTRFRNKTLTQHIEENDFLSVQILIKSNPALVNRLNSEGYAPLHDAVIYGQTGMVRFLIALGADVNILTSRAPQMTARKLWVQYHPLQKNPLTRYCRTQDLEMRKTEITTLIQNKMPGTLRTLYSNLRSEKILLEKLRHKIMHASFHSTDSYDKTADDVLMEIVNEWAREYNVEDESPSFTACKPQGLFARNTSSPKRTIEVLQAIRPLLCDTTIKHTDTPSVSPIESLMVETVQFGLVGVL